MASNSEALEEAQGNRQHEGVASNQARVTGPTHLPQICLHGKEGLHLAQHDQCAGGAGADECAEDGAHLRPRAPRS